MSRKRDHLCVCICTYKRPERLGRLLDSLMNQETHDLFSYSIAVVDNDCEETAGETIAQARKTASVPIRYEIEPEQNISLARNKALQVEVADYLACIDDDEFADACWLSALYRAVTSYQADGVLGPVFPSFETRPPPWVTRGGFFSRKSYPTGTVLTNPKYTRCGNFIVSSRIIRGLGDPFNPEFGKTGGEDVDFFKRMIERGHTFVWCQEAKVFESIPPSRLTRSYLLKRALLRGVVSARRASLLSPDTLKSLLAFFLYVLILPFLFLIRHHLFMRFLIKACDHIGKLTARCGIRLIRRRPDQPNSDEHDCSAPARST